MSFTGFLYYKSTKPDTDVERICVSINASRCSTTEDGKCIWQYYLNSSDLDDFEPDNFEPIIWKIAKEYDPDKSIKIEKLDGFTHLHSANRIEKDDIVYTGVTNSGKSQILRKNKNEIKTIKIERLPSKVYTYKNTVLMLYKNKNIGTLYKVDFDNEKLVFVAKNVFCNIPDVSQRKLAETIFIKDNKILYKAVQNGNVSSWILIEDGEKSALSADGKCVGFNSENTVVFYQELFETFFNLAYGKFVQYDLRSGDKTILSTVVSKNKVQENFAMLPDNIHALTLIENHEGSEKTCFMNIQNGLVTYISPHSWMPGSDSTVMTVG